MYLKLSPEQKQQIVDMTKDGKQPGEIIDFFLQNYKIELTEKKIRYILSKAKKAKAPRKAKRHYKARKSGRAHAQQGSDEPVDVEELIKILKQLDAGYKALVAHFQGKLVVMRGELLKSRGEVYDMLHKSGIEIPPGGES